MIHHRQRRCLGIGGTSGHDLQMVEYVKSLQHPVQIAVGDRTVDLVTIGYVANVLDRTSWTIKYWTRLGLFPEPPYFLNPKDSCTRRRLYPADFIDALAIIVSHGYVGRRLDRHQWHRFRVDVFDAFDVSMSGRTGVVTAKNNADRLDAYKGASREFTPVSGVAGISQLSPTDRPSTVSSVSRDITGF